ncbi:MAG: hypothetical protein HUK26_04275 [Duodenibacillus sp.]|nr:hypothetical protein [Duodenibacillus sp.]
MPDDSQARLEPAYAIHDFHKPVASPLAEQLIRRLYAQLYFEGRSDEEISAALNVGRHGAMLLRDQLVRARTVESFVQGGDLVARDPGAPRPPRPSKPPKPPRPPRPPAPGAPPPWSKDAIRRLPPAACPLPVRAVASREELCRACVEAAAEAVVGFDAEEVPAVYYDAGDYPSPAVIQIATGRTAWVIPVSRRLYGVDLAGLAPLAAVLESGNVVKAGCGVHADVDGAARLIGCGAGGAVDLHALAAPLLPRRPGRWGLQSLAALALGRYLSKPSKVQMSHWGRLPLTARQIAYAAADAWAGRAVYLALEAARAEGRTSLLPPPGSPS